MPGFPDVQIGAAIALCRDICGRWGIRPEAVLAHSDVAPGRKIDPGELFPWRRLYEEGVGHHVPARTLDGASLREGDEGPEVEALQSMLAVYGYGVEISGRYDDATRIVVEAFQRHFRQDRVDGVADAETRDLLDRLLQALAFPKG